MKNLITIVMPVYNAERFLREAVESVLQQTYQNWELLMLDDCSKDSSLRLAREFEATDGRIHVIPSDKNSGVARVRNRGIQMAKGDYIALLDSDDVWTPDKLERQLKLMQKNDAQIGYCSYDFIDEQGDGVQKPFVVPESTNYKQMLACNMIGCSTVVVKAELIQQHPFSTEFYHEDYVLWMELLSISAVRAVGITDTLVHYRRVNGSRSDNKINAAKERWRIYRGALGMGVIPSVIYFLKYTVNGVIKYYI